MKQFHQLLVEDTRNQIRPIIPGLNRHTTLNSDQTLHDFLLVRIGCERQEESRPIKLLHDSRRILIVLLYISNAANVARRRDDTASYAVRAGSFISKGMLDHKIDLKSVGCPGDDRIPNFKTIP